MKVAKYSFYIYAVLLACVAWSCERDDDEPRKARKPISRLYVSTSEYVPNSADAQVRNVFVIDPADSSEFTAQGALAYTSGAKGGSAIHFSPFAKNVFQASMNTPAYIDTIIQVLSVNENGQLAPWGTIGNRLFNNIKGLWYNSFDNQLLFTNLGNDTVSVFVVNRPTNIRGFARPAYQVMLDDRVWGMQLDSTHLYLSKTGVDGGILVFKDFVDVVNAKRDTLVKDLQPDYRLTVPGTNNIRGLSYSKVADILVLSDYIGEGTNGRVLIFENFSSHKTNGTLTPTRVISGTATSLQQPLDVAIDAREGGPYIYVADAKAKRILRFNITDEGNVAPDAELSVGNTPQSLFLDSRGPNE
ncbi:MAG TPA: hypothetical protein PKA53_06225 [Sphingobacterium sp.]|nr:hypothetical protein [Sphingobacterium sp.]